MPEPATSPADRLKARFGDAIRGVRHAVGGHNASAGSRCGFAYGEMFALPGPVGANDLVALVTGAKATTPAPVDLPGQPPPPLA